MILVSEAFRLIGTHFVTAADLFEQGDADAAKVHYDRAGVLAQALLDTNMFDKGGAS